MKILCLVLAAASGLNQRGLQVVDGRTGAPVAGATVVWEHTRPSRDWPFELAVDATEGPLTFDRIERELLGRGRVVKSNQFGLADAVDPTLWPRVLVHKDDLFGFDFSSASRLPDDVRIELFPDRSVEVLVRDRSGKPCAGAVVKLRSSASTGVFDQHLRAQANESGIARLEHAGSIMASVTKRLLEPGSPRTWSLALDDLFKEETVPIQLDRWPSEPVELVAPSGGIVEIRFVDRAGVPVFMESPVVLTRRENVWFHLKDEWVGDDALEVLGVLDRLPSAYASANGERSVFKPVPVGASLAVVFQRNRASVKSAFAFAGPQSIGERIVVNVELGVRSATFVGRLVSSSGTPIAHSGIELLVEPTSTEDFALNQDEINTSALRLSVVTDANGRFAVDRSPMDLDVNSARLVFTAKLGEPNSISAAVDVGTRWAAGTHDLGDVVLTPSPTVLSGVLSSRDGTSVADARVAIAGLNTPDLTARTDAKGAFRLSSRRTLGDVKLCLESPRGVWRRVGSYTPGTKDLNIVVPHFATVRGKFDGVTSNVSIGLTNDVSENDCFVEPSNDGSFEITDIVPGVYDCVVIVGGRWLPVSRPKVVVQPGADLDIGAISLPADK